MKAAANSVDIIIVNWNAGHYLAECLESIHASAARESWSVGRVVVVDNASDDDSLQQAASWVGRPDTTLVRNPTNRGFGEACNQGASCGTAPLILFLNPDARLLPGALDRVCDLFASPGGRMVGICGCRVVDEQGRDAVIGGPFPTPRLVIGHVTGLSKLVPSLFPPRHPPTPDRDTAVDHVIGAFFVTRRDVFDQLGGFDERYFMYYEEVDFCMRARQLGWLTFFLSDARVEHVGNVSSNQIRARRLFYSMRSRRQYARRHWSATGNVVLTLLTFTVELPARAMIEIYEGERVVPRETMLAYVLYVRDLCGPRTNGRPRRVS